MAENHRDIDDTRGESNAETPALQEIPAAVWHLLEAGVRRAADPSPPPVLAAQGDHGPAQRTVVPHHVEAGG